MIRDVKEEFFSFLSFAVILKIFSLSAAAPSLRSKIDIDGLLLTLPYLNDLKEGEIKRKKWSQRIRKLIRPKRMEFRRLLST